MSARAKHLILIAAAFAAAFIIWEIWRAIRAGMTDAKAILFAPYRALAALGNSIVSNAAIAADNAATGLTLPGLISQSQSLDSQIAAAVGDDYEPGGRIYEKILAQSGQAAADAARAAHQKNVDTMTSQDSVFSFFDW